MKKKVAIIGTVGLPAKYGGWETLVDNLTKEISDSYDITVFCSSKRYDLKPESYNGVKLQYINLDANGAQSIVYDLFSMLKSLKFADTFLILGVSGCVFLPFFRLFTNKKIIVNIDGIEWKRAKWGGGAKWFLKVSEGVAVRFANITVTDNKAIQAYVKTEYGRPSELIAYGANHVTYKPLSDEVIAKYPFLKKAYAFKVCRIEPENNLHIILEAFKVYSELELVIVGNWNNSEYGESLKSKYNLFEHIHLLDPIYDQKILNQLRSSCNIYLHGHSAGGTNPSLVEAMYLGLPIIAFSGIYNRETTHGEAEYFSTTTDLIYTLNEMQPNRLDSLGKNMKRIAEKEYTWEKISRLYSELLQ